MKTRFIAVLLACLWFIMPAHSAPPKPSPPNLLFVLADQWRGQALGFLGEDPVVTPHLDRFSTEGLVLPQAVSNYPVCSPYRAMLMTGQYPINNGVLGNSNSRGAQLGYELRKNALCWSDVLHDRGYRQAWIGKWHLESPRKPYVKCENNSATFAWNEWTPPARRHGFDFWYAYNTFDYHMNPLYWANDTPRDKPLRVNQWGPEHEADKAIAFIRETAAARRPFACVVSMNPPHMPYTAFPKRYLKAYEGKSMEQIVTRGNVNILGRDKFAQLARAHTRNYYAMMTGVDDQFGRILKALRDANLARNTIVVFTSDHGNCIGSHNQISKNNHYEESMRIPFLIRWPGKIPVRKDDLLFSVPDVYPTLLSLMGFGRDIPEKVEGTDYSRLFRTGKGQRPTSQLYLKIGYVPRDQGSRGVRTHRYTLRIEKRKDGTVQRYLHDNQADSWQLKNIAAERPKLVRQLIEKELQPWLSKTKDPWKP